MKKIYIVGAGPGNPDLLTAAAGRAINESDCIIAHSRLIEQYKNTKKQLFDCASPKKIADYIAQLDDKTVISVLVSGDTGFYSLSKLLINELKDMGDIKVLSGISSVQYFCSQLHSSWDDALILSLHGRDENIVQKVKQNCKVILLTGTNNTPERIAAALCENNLEHVTITVGENLSYVNEKLTAGSAREIAGKTFSPLSVVQIENPNPSEHMFISDDAFIRGNTPMTKQEIRQISISKLQLKKKDNVFDIGAGTGSVAVEMALQIPNGKVYAIEKEADAVELINENRQKFYAANLEIIQGNAAEVLLDLPVPDKAFIGGSGGEMVEILDKLYIRNPEIRVVMNAVTLETLCEITNYYKNRNEYLMEVVNISVAFTRKIGGYNLLAGQNPVYIITVSRKDTSHEA